LDLTALACGTPVITFDTGGSGESIANNCGYVLDENSISEIYEKIQDNKRKGKSKLENSPRQHAESFYDKNVKYREYIDLYKMLNP
jgi:putative colanic acid biosynthesis glycosyltransferase